MKKSAIPLAMTVALLGSTALAQAINFSQIDTNGDQILQQEELVAAFGDVGAATVAALDTDGDGNVSLEEASDTGGAENTNNNASDRGIAARTAQGDNRSARGLAASEAKGGNRSERGLAASGAQGDNRSEGATTARDTGGETRSERGSEPRETSGDRGGSAGEAKGDNRSDRGSAASGAKGNNRP
jgi:hypothetical protein